MQAIKQNLDMQDNPETVLLLQLIIWDNMHAYQIDDLPWGEGVSENDGPHLEGIKLGNADINKKIRTKT